jgi:uncharacterized protein (TIGR02147 family)
MSATDFRTILRSEYAARRQRNESYSLRAFARTLGMSASRLSEVLNDGQRLSRSSAMRVATALGYEGERRDRFCDLVEAENPKSERLRAGARARLTAQHGAERERRLDDQALTALGSWLSFAILELVQPPAAAESTRALAKRLRVTTIEVEDALARLVRAGLVRRVRRGFYEATGATHAAGDGGPSVPLRELHRQLITKSLRALEEQVLGERRFDALMLRVDARKLPQAFERLQRFIVEMDEEFGVGPGRDELYAVTLQMFNLASGRKT